MCKLRTFILKIVSSVALTADLEQEVQVFRDYFYCCTEKCRFLKNPNFLTSSL